MKQKKGKCALPKIIKCKIKREQFIISVNGRWEIHFLLFFTFFVFMKMCNWASFLLNTVPLSENSWFVTLEVQRCEVLNILHSRDRLSSPHRSFLGGSNSSKTIHNKSLSWIMIDRTTDWQCFCIICKRCFI